VACVDPICRPRPAAAAPLRPICYNDRDNDLPRIDAMTTAQLRKQAKDRLDSLPPDKVRVAAEFLDYLESAASRDATAELLTIPGLLDDVTAAAEHIKNGRFKDWRKVRKDV
jgi:hypothetical protein